MRHSNILKGRAAALIRMLIYYTGSTSAVTSLRFRKIPLLIICWREKKEEVVCSSGSADCFPTFCLICLDLTRTYRYDAIHTSNIFIMIVNSSSSNSGGNMRVLMRVHKQQCFINYFSQTRKLESRKQTAIFF